MLLLTLLCKETNIVVLRQCEFLPPLKVNVLYCTVCRPVNDGRFKSNSEGQPTRVPCPCVAVFGLVTPSLWGH